MNDLVDKPHINVMLKNSDLLDIPHESSTTLTQSVSLSSPATSRAPWLAKNMEHSNGITSLVIPLQSNWPGRSTETQADARRNLQKKSQWVSYMAEISAESWTAFSYLL